MDLAPLFRLRLRTPQLELRLPSPAEVLELFAVAESGIHPPDEMPFGVAWTDRLDRDDFAAFHAAALASWTPERWDCNFVTFRRGGGAIGTQSLHGRDFGATREVSTGSWLGQAHQGHGLGTEQRAAVLELAFRTLDALAAVTGALVHNRASQRVSEKLGYRFTHEDTLSPRGTPVPQRNYRLERNAWASPIPDRDHRRRAVPPAVRRRRHLRIGTHSAQIRHTSAHRAPVACLQGVRTPPEGEIAVASRGGRSRALSAATSARRRATAAS